MSVDLMTPPMVDEARQRLEQLRAELDEERKTFTEATVRLGKERASIEVIYNLSLK
jgi:hypothetical protein